MVCPGGGYGILAYDLEGTEICQWLNSLGINAVLLKYRVPDGRDHPLQDAQRAMGMVRLHAAEWHIDPKKLGVIGFSAGGHLSASLSTHFASRTYPPVDKADELSCRPDFAMLIYPAYLVQDKDLEKLATDITVSADTPQTFLVQTENDFAHSECSLFYYLALKKAKVAAELHLYPGDTHGYGLRPARDPVASTWTKRAEEWMRHQKILPAEPAPLASP